MCSTKTIWASDSQLIPYKTGDWSYEDSSAKEGGLSNAKLDGQKPQDWFFDEYTTIQRTNFDTVKLTFAPSPDSLTVTVYRQDDPQDTGTDVPVSDSGEITLDAGDVNMVYVVKGEWSSEHYQAAPFTASWSLRRSNFRNSAEVLFFRAEGKIASGEKF